MVSLCLLQNFAGQFSNGLGCTLGICGLSLAVYAASDFILYFLWYRKARKNAAENQSFNPYKGKPDGIDSDTGGHSACGVRDIFDFTGDWQE